MELKVYRECETEEEAKKTAAFIMNGGQGMARTAICRGRTVYLNDYKALTEALIKAKEAARAAGVGVYDGGTCNFDNPAMVFDRIERAEAERAIKDAGLRSFEWDFASSKEQVALVISGMTAGQGDQRTTMAEAFKDSMRAQGYKCGMYYQMD